MKLFRVKFADNEFKDRVLVNEPQFVPGFVVMTENDRTKVAFPVAYLSKGFSWTYIDKNNPNYDILKLKVSKEK